MSKPKGVRLLHIIYAWQHFAGKPLKVTDAEEIFTDREIGEQEDFLIRTRNWCRSQDATKWPELHQLADQIEMELNR